MKQFATIIMFCLLLTSCQKSQETRTYTEVIIKASAPEVPNAEENVSIDISKPLAKGSPDPHAGFTKEQLAEMLKEQSQLSIDNTVNNIPYSWTLPEAWEEKPATGMRLATFIEKINPTAIDCSIITLSPGAGGLEENIIRWLGQINMTNLTETELRNFINATKNIPLKNGLSAQLIEFTDLQKSALLTAPSMIAAIIDTSEQRVFIKMTGEKANVLNNSESFKSFVQSFEIRSPR